MSRYSAQDKAQDLPTVSRMLEIADVKQPRDEYA